MRLPPGRGFPSFAAMSAFRARLLRPLLPLLTLCFLGAAARPASFVLTLVEVEQLANDHVGDEWVHTARVDGWQMEVGDRIDLASAEAYRIECNSRETDPHFPDHGVRSLRMSERDMTAAAAEGGFTVDVTVREGHGEFAGNTAMWRFHFSLR